MFGSGYNKQKLSLFYINVTEILIRRISYVSKEQHMDNCSQVKLTLNLLIYLFDIADAVDNEVFCHWVVFSFK